MVKKCCLAGKVGVRKISSVNKLEFFCFKTSWESHIGAGIEFSLVIFFFLQKEKRKIVRLQAHSGETSHGAACPILGPPP